MAKKVIWARFAHPRVLADRGNMGEFDIGILRRHGEPFVGYHLDIYRANRFERDLFRDRASGEVQEVPRHKVMSGRAESGRTIIWVSENAVEIDRNYIEKWG